MSESSKTLPAAYEPPSELITEAAPRELCKQEKEGITHAFSEDLQKICRLIFHDELKRLASKKSNGGHSKRTTSNPEEGLKNWLRGLEQGQWSAKTNDMVAHLLAEHGLALPPVSAAYGEVRLLTARAIVAANRVAAAMKEGDFSYVVEPERGTPGRSVIISNPILKAKEVDTQELTIRQMIGFYLSEKRPQWVSPWTELSHRVVFRALEEVLGGERKVNSVTRVDCLSIRDLFRSIPKNAKQRFPGLTLQEAAEKAEAAGAKLLSPRAIESHLIVLSTFFAWGHRQWLVERNPAKGLARETFPRRQGNRRKPFTTEELRAIFSAPLYTGCEHDWVRYYRPGPNKPRNARFWVPILALWTGMRLTEICQLECGDIRCIKGIDCIVISPMPALAQSKARKCVKSAAGERVIPIHPELRDIGFLHYVRTMRYRGEVALFPDLPVNRLGSYSPSFSSWFHRFLRSIGVNTSGTSFHSFRHTFRGAIAES